MLANAATMRILIKGGKVVNDDCTLEADVYIENGIIQQVGRELMIPGGAKVIDATGKLVIPGGIDTSTHFHQTFMNATCVDDFYHGTKVPPGHSPPLHSLGLLLPARSARSPSPQLGEGSLAPKCQWVLQGFGTEHLRPRGMPARRERSVAGSRWQKLCGVSRLSAPALQAAGCIKSPVGWHCARLSPCPHPSGPLAVNILLPPPGPRHLCRHGVPLLLQLPACRWLWPPRANAAGMGRRVKDSAFQQMSPQSQEGEQRGGCTSRIGPQRVQPTCPQQRCSLPCRDPSVPHRPCWGGMVIQFQIRAWQAQVWLSWSHL